MPDLFDDDYVLKYFHHPIVTKVGTLLNSKGALSLDDYKSCIHDIFGKHLEAGNDDPVWDLLGHLENDTDFLTAPASTRFHGAYAHGLVRHSLLVLSNAVKLVPFFFNGDPDLYFLAAAAFFHDLCKVDMYEVRKRNVKNEKTGQWSAENYYSVKKDYLAFGHGVESQLRINEYITLPLSWNHAVRWHMGAYDATDTDGSSMKAALSRFPEVLLLQTADMKASLSE
jgi:hypothetical protein